MATEEPVGHNDIDILHQLYDRITNTEHAVDELVSEVAGLWEALVLHSEVTSQSPKLVEGLTMSREEQQETFKKVTTSIIEIRELTRKLLDAASKRKSG